MRLGLVAALLSAALTGVAASVKAENTAKRFLDLVRQQAKLGQVPPLVILNAEQTYLQAVINRIQEGMSAELNFQAIVDLVGDKLNSGQLDGQIRTTTGR